MACPGRRDRAIARPWLASPGSQLIELAANITTGTVLFLVTPADFITDI